MKKVFALALFFVLILSACGKSDENWGSFTSEKTYSYDGKYYAVQGVTEGMILVSVYTKDNKLVHSFMPARSSDFWGICWEKDSYNIWIQSSDIGIYCYKPNDLNMWILDENEELPDYIRTRYDSP